MIVGVVSAVLAIAWLGENVLERIPVAESHLTMLAATALGTLALIVWFARYSPAPRGLRRTVGRGSLLVLVLLLILFRLDSVSGNVWPKLAFPGARECPNWKFCITI